MRFCDKNPKSVDAKLKISKAIKLYALKLKEAEEKTKKSRLFVCKNCNKEYTLELTDKEYEKHRYSDFCCRKCAKQFSAYTVNDEELKEAKCISCGKTIYIKKRASIKTCKCQSC